MLKIISGSLKGRTLAIAKNSKVRPSTSKIRGAIFNTVFSYLNSKNLYIDQLTVLDAFAGSGSLGIEAISRGFTKVTFMELHYLTYKTLKDNLQNMQIMPDKYDVLLVNTCTVRQSIEKPVNIVFFDPPYNLNLMPKAYNNLYNKKWIDQNTIVIYESAKSANMPDLGREWLIIKNYGTIKIAIC